MIFSLQLVLCFNDDNDNDNHNETNYGRYVKTKCKFAISSGGVKTSITRLAHAL